MAKALRHDPPADTASNMQLPIGGKALWMGGSGAQHQLFSTAAGVDMFEIGCAFFFGSVP